MTSKSEYSLYQFRKVSVTEDGTIMKFICMCHTNENEEFEAFRNHHNSIVVWFDSANNKFSIVDPLLKNKKSKSSFSWEPKYKLFHGELIGDFGTNGDQFLWMDAECGAGQYDLLLVTGQASCLFLERYLAGEHDQSLYILREFADALAKQVL